MHFIFWQKNLSIHQSAFLRELAIHEQVTLVVKEEFNPARRSQGWHRPDFGLSRIMVGPSDQEIQNLITNDSEAIHVFSGFFGVSMIAFAYKQVFVLRYTAFFFLEPFDVKGIKGKLRYLKYSNFIRKHRSKIKGLLVTGEKAKKLYQKCGMPANKVFSWGYFTEVFGEKAVERNNLKVCQILYVGTINRNKNIIPLVKLVKGLNNFFGKFLIIGGGPLKEELKELIKDENKIEYFGNVSNQLVKKYLCEVDLLILPSKYDGWGAVVNEALQAGTPVIASENCGAESLLDGEIRGEVFSFSGKNNLEVVLKKWLGKGKVSIEHRKAIQEWSQKNISGEAAAGYFVEIVEYLEGRRVERPVAPWILNG
ncbi:glycosyltransferase family 4 protein [Fontibacter flavus]|uniref:Glycosyltransferase family 4 protein n=1 Tax=Fontibacter flavus TaxID=654838 RepID=A0ABV6FVT2_9BACT